ncbi:hypothetical protein Q8A73_012896 [Channa argus]|nr:hypothetical protein Q8A73_012896 [Channa argus]
MERSIGELERAVLESSVLLEHLKLGAERKASESRRPDGTSVGRSTHCNPDHGRRGPLPITAVKLQRYSGLTPLEPYLAQVELAALHGGWSGEETATHLALALEGPALQVLADLLPEDRRELQAITAALQRRHDGESLGAFAADLHPMRLPHLSGCTPRGTEPPLLSAGASTRATSPTCPPVNTPLTGRGPERSRACRGGAGGWFSTGPIPVLAQASQGSQPGGRRGAPRRRGNHPGPASCHTTTTKGRSLPSLDPSSRFQPLLQIDCPTVGRCGAAMGLYIDCVIAGQLCRALVDTGSTICLLRRGVLPGTAGPLPADWTPTTTELLTVTGKKTVMPGKKLLPVVVGAQQISHEFWLADIRDDCIVGLDLLARWGACVDVPGSSICLGAETIPLRSGRSAAGESQRRRGSCTARASAPEQPHRDHRSPAQAGQERQRRRRGSCTTRTSAPEKRHRDHRSPAQAGQERQRRRRGSCTTRTSAPEQPHRDHRSPAQAGQEGQRRRRGSCTTRTSAPQQPHRDHRSPAQAGQEGQRRHRGSRKARASVPQQPPPRAYAPPSDETAAAVAELAQRSGGHLDAAQRQQLNRLLQDFVDIFAARDKDCTRTGLVQHHIDTGDAPPIGLRPHRLPLVKCQAAQELIESMVANDIIEPSDSPYKALNGQAPSYI